MIVVIAGSRTIDDYNELLSAIAESGFEITQVVSGCARGADLLGERWARENSVELERRPAHWTVYGKSAGIRRNAEMADYADAAIILWDGVSRGTANMIEQMKKRSKPVFVWRVKTCQ